jgi:hypothetical protein
VSLRKIAWIIAEAGGRIGDWIERALAAVSQTIARKGSRAMDVVSVAEFTRNSPHNGKLAEFFAKSPLCGSGLNVERLKDEPRRIRL